MCTSCRTNNVEHNLNINNNIINMRANQMNALTYDRMTYLQFCTLPNYFNDYISELKQNDKISTICDIFVFYTQTLMQFVPSPIGIQLRNIQIQYYQASALGLSMVNLLKIMLSAIPIQQIDATFNINIPLFMYSILFKDIGSIDENVKLILEDWFWMLALQYDVVKGKKIALPHEKNERLSKIYQNILSIQSSYSQLAQKMMKLNRKLEYVFRQSSNNVNNQKKLSEMEIEDIQSNFKDTQVSPLFTKCSSANQKINFTRISLQKLFFQGDLDSKSLDSIQLMCLLVLQQIKLKSISSKLQIYLMMITINLLKSSNINTLLQQIRNIYSFQRVPSIQYCYFLIYAIMKLPSDTSTQAKLKQIIQFLLKSYSKTTNQKQYVKLAILSSLHLYKVAGGQINDNSRKQLLQRLSQFQDCVSFINNIETIKYLHQLLLRGKQVKLLNLKPQKSQDEFMLSGNDINNAFTEGLEDKQKEIASQAVLDLPHGKLESLHRKLIKKRLNLSLQNPQDYLVSRLMFMLMETENGAKLTQKSLNQNITLVHQWSIISTYHNIPERISKSIFAYLYINLLSQNKMIESMICAEVSGIKVNYERVQLYIRNNHQQFYAIPEQIFENINSYELVEMFGELFKTTYEAIVSKWIKNDENYLYSWPESRKQRLLQNKRNRFAKYMVKINKQQN